MILGNRWNLVFEKYYCQIINRKIDTHAILKTTKKKRKGKKRNEMKEKEKTKTKQNKT